QRLDDYTGRWLERRTDVCQATRVRGEQSEEVLDLRMHCLDRRLAEVGALGAALGAADAHLIGRALDLVDSLQPLATCDDIAALSAAKPLPADPARRAAVEALDPRLADLELSQRTGEYDKTLAAARTVLAEARTLGYAPYQAEALSWQAMATRSTGKMADAERLFYQTITAAEEAGLDRLRAQMWIALSFVHMDTSRFADAHRDLDFARAVLAHRGSDPAIDANLLQNEGLLFWYEERNTEAADRLQQALALLERQTPRDDQSIVLVLSNLTGLYSHMRRLDDALATGTRARDLLVATRGPDHPWLSDILGNLATVYDRKGQAAEAARLFEQTLAIKRKHLPPDHPGLVNAIINVAAVAEDHHDWPRALAGYQEALTIRERALGANNFELSLPLVGMGRALDELGRPTEAEPLLRRALALREHAPTAPEHLAEIRFELARALWASKHDRPGALRLADQAIAGLPEGENRTMVQAWRAQHR
ncbi:MAG TPA: tetratricopeptide repeat protein, partial [Kofleriaceae bacterium]|nr:tetratricopeptide repeat protein [Kofleriaceae bacterium]